MIINTRCNCTVCMANYFVSIIKEEVAQNQAKQNQILQKICRVQSCLGDEDGLKRKQMN